MVEAQLAERSLPNSVILGSNANIGNNIFRKYSSVNGNLEKTKVKKNRLRMARFIFKILTPDYTTV